MSEKMLESLGHLFLALSDKTRLRLLSLIDGDEVSVGFLAESLSESQPKISRHLAYLRRAGIVSTRRDGKWMYYAIARQSEPAADEMLTAVLRSMRNRESGPRLNNNRPESKNIYVKSEMMSADGEYVYAEPDINEWEPAELDIFLL